MKTLIRPFLQRTARFAAALALTAPAALAGEAFLNRTEGPLTFFV